MENKLGQEMAFPGETTGFVQKGISKRFYVACMAMQGLLMKNGLANGYDELTLHNSQILVNQAYIVADELLKQENL